MGKPSEKKHAWQGNRYVLTTDLDEVQALIDSDSTATDEERERAWKILVDRLVCYAPCDHCAKCDHCKEIEHFHGHDSPHWWCNDIRANVATWPALSVGQRAVLRVLLRPISSPMD